MECLIPKPHTIYYYEAERYNRRSLAICRRSESRNIEKKFNVCTNPGNLEATCIPTNDPSIFNNQISLCVTLFRIWGSRESIHRYKKSTVPFCDPGDRYCGPLRMHVFKDRIFGSQGCVRASLGPRHLPSPARPIGGSPLSPLHWFLLILLFCKTLRCNK